MILAQWLSQNAVRLSDLGIASARLDCLILLEDVLQQNKAWILAHDDFTLDNKTLTVLDNQIAKRAKHIPLAYIRGESEFYGRTFIITNSVLQPRPETETLIDLLKNLAKEPKTIIDVGTGSGAIAVTVKLELPFANVFATDIDPSCINVAKQNAIKHKTSISFKQGNLLDPINDIKPDVILANLPYVPNGQNINQAATKEPKIAIFGGPDGLALYRDMFTQIATFLQFANVKHVLTESLPPQHVALIKIAKKCGFTLSKTQDLIQVFSKI